jgi:hypothetical protein
MAGNDSQDPRAGPEVRKASLLISGLMLTSDADLEAFRKRRAANPDLDPAHLRRARDLLDAIAEAIASTDEARWGAVARAWAALRVDGAAPGERHSDRGTSVNVPEVTLQSMGAAGGPAPPPRVGTVLGPDQIPEGIEIPHKPSPWLKPIAAMEASAQTGLGQPRAVPPPPRSQPPALPVQPPAPAQAPPPPPHSAPPPPLHAGSPPSLATLNSPYGLRPAPAPPAVEVPPPGVDIAALDKIKLDSGDPATMPAEVVATGSLPFRGARAAPPPSALEDSYEHDPLNRTTAAADLPALVKSARSLPFDPQAELAPHLASITLEQYATLSAECSMSPAWSETIQQRYGIRSAEERTALDRLWRRRIVEDEELSRLYRWHFSRYQEWARTRR